jgi:hypothetical protein
MKAKILKGIRHRIEMLEQQVQLIYDNAVSGDLSHVIYDSQTRLDELYSLEEWVEGLKDD